MKTYGTIQHGVDANDNDGWIINASPHVAMRIKRMFPRVWQGRTGAIEIKSTPEICRDLEWVMQRWPLEMSDAARAYLIKGADSHRATEKMAADILSGNAEPLPAVRKPLREPREYQATAADLTLNMGRLLLVDDVGLGKTFTGLLLLKAPDTLPAVVVCQTHLASQWLEQLALTWGDLRGYEVKKGQPYDLTTVCDGHEPDVIVVPYSKIAGWGDHLAGLVKTVIFDEIQELRHPGTLKYVGAERVSTDAAYRIGLTATPIYNYGAEVWSVLNIVAPGALGGSAEFNREWTTGYKGRVHSPEALGEHLRDESLMLVRTRKDVGRELDEPIRIPQHVDTDSDAFERAKGNAMEMARLILDTAASKTDRWQASGELDWRMRMATGVAKAPFVAEFVRMLLETEDKVVLFGWHRDVYDIWMEALAEFNPRLYTGSETPKHKDAAKAAFIGTPEERERAQWLRSEGYEPDQGYCRVLIMSLRSGAGVDGLQEVCSTAVFGELDWSPKVHEQAIGRLFRDGQMAAVAAYFCVSHTGADPLMAEVLSLKEQQSTAIVHPGAEPFTTVADPTDRMKELARQVLSQNGEQ